MSETKFGTRVGRWTIDSLIGQGGMGSVYLGIDKDTGEKVAIKEIKPEFITNKTSDVLVRLRREGEALRRLNHPNIVKMYEIVETDNAYSIILEYVGGGSLRNLMQKQPQMPLEHTLKIALELADALSRAHHLKIIHRDLKPANVLLADDGTPRLTDFGLVSMEEQPHLTQSGTVVGTYAYLSPEALQEAEPDFKRDIWAFGVMLFELLAGRLPFDGNSAPTVILSIMQNDLPDIAELRPSLPPRLIALVQHMLQKDPELRISSARRVGVELEEIIGVLDSGTYAALDSELKKNPGRFATPLPSSMDTISGDVGVMPTPSATPKDLDTFLTPSQPAPATDPQPTAIETPKRNRTWVGLGVIGLLVVAAVMVFAFIANNGDETADVAEVPEIIEVPPVAADEFLVLVAHLEPLEDERPVDRFIFDDLIENIELSSSATRIRIVEYPAVIRSSEEADEVAAVNQAPLVIWGNYAEDLLEVEFQLNFFTEPQISLDFLYEAGNVRLRMEDERSASLAPQILIGYGIWHTFRGDPFELARALLAMDDLSATPAETASSTVATRTYDALLNWLINPEMSVELMDIALRQSPGNPILYNTRGTSYQRIGDDARGFQDFNSSLRLSNEEWSLAYITLAQYFAQVGDTQGALDAATAAVELAPDQWLPWGLQGSYEYLLGNYEAAEVATSRALELDPPSSFPYLIATNLAIRKGELARVTELMDTIVTGFPDPRLENRMIETFTGGDEETGNNTQLSLLTSAFTNLTLGQSAAALEDIESALQLEGEIVELYLLQGVAYCIESDFVAAAEAFTQGIEREPDFTVFYLLRSDAYRKQGGKDAEAFADFVAATETPGWANFQDVLEESANLGCADFL